MRGPLALPLQLLPRDSEVALPPPRLSQHCFRVRLHLLLPLTHPSRLASLWLLFLANHYTRFTQGRLWPLLLHLRPPLSCQILMQLHLFPPLLPLL